MSPNEPTHYTDRTKIVFKCVQNPEYFVFIVVREFVVTGLCLCEAKLCLCVYV